MKKLVLIMVGLFLLTTANAQDKAALKAQKAAKKAAEKTLKEVRNIYEMSIPNPQYGRKETNFDKLETALPLVQTITESEYTKDNPQAWKLATDIQIQYFTKIENESKADPDNEEIKKKYIDCSSKLLNYCIKYDSLLALDTKVKPEEKVKEHKTYQTRGVNAAVPLLQAAQNYSNSDKQDELKLGVLYAEQFIATMDKSGLMKDFTHQELAGWKTYAKAFRAQAYLDIKGTPEEKIVSSYEELFDSNFKGIAYQSLSNYYRETDKAKQNKYLQAGIEALKDDAEQKDLRANFVTILMQNQFEGGDVEGFKKTAEIMKTEYADNDNTVNAYLMEGQIAFEAKDYDTAKNIFLTGNEKYPDEPKCLLMAARSAWMKAQANGSKKPDMEEAIKLFKQIEAANPNDPELWGESLYVLYNNTQQPKLAANYKKYYKATK